jgi:hypothetical protein
VAFEHDDGATIQRVPSPSTLNLGALFSRYVIAVVGILAVVVAPLWYLGRRIGPALPIDAGEASDDRSEEGRIDGSTVDDGGGGGGR